jgi:hypothetical protein
VGAAIFNHSFVTTLSEFLTFNLFRPFNLLSTDFPMKEEFNIKFNFEGTQYSGIVKPGERENDLTYIVQYTTEPDRKFQQTIELCESSTEETGLFEWIQLHLRKGETPCDQLFIQCLGEAIENSDFV